MIGDLQRKKAHHYFDLIDEDDNDYIEAQDFETRADRLAKRRNLDDGTARESLRRRVLGWWTDLCTAIDKNEDDRVSRDEWIGFWTTLQTAVEQAETRDNEVIKSLIESSKATFHAMDTSGTGKITEEEYTDWLEAWGADGSSEAFRRLDRSDNGVLTKEDLTEATLEFYLSNDPEAPGNMLYGSLPE